MERIMTPEERIKRAEELYYNRQQSRGERHVKVPSSTVNNNVKPEYVMAKKLILKILICLLIYLIFYLIKNSNYIFSDEVINKTKEFLNYDINFKQIYDNTVSYYNNEGKQFLSGLGITFGNEEGNNEIENTQNSNEVQAKQTEQTEQTQQTVQTDQTQQQTEQVDQTQQTVQTEQITEGQENIIGENGEVTQTGGIGGGTQEEVVQLSQMEIDANDIKANYSLIVPLKGTITSRFGPRTPTQIVSANHGGIDIGVNAGTVFVASMEGIVTEVSSEGDYGNHIYIQNGDVVTLYAHCQTIYLQAGQNVTQGQNVGEVGSTGKATGPHLHFEIRKSGRLVNPEYVLNFE